MFLAAKNVVFRVVNNVSIHDGDVLKVNLRIRGLTAKIFSWCRLVAVCHTLILITKASHPHYNFITKPSLLIFRGEDRYLSTR